MTHAAALRVAAFASSLSLSFSFLARMVDGVARPLITQAFIPLSTIEDALPRLLLSFSGSLFVGSCAIDHADESQPRTVGDVTKRNLTLTFLTQTLEDYDLQCIEEDLQDVYFKVQENNEQATEDELDDLVNAEFLRRHGCTYEDKMAQLESHCRGTSLT